MIALPATLPETGILQFTIPVAPVSHQATGWKKRMVRDIVRSMLSRVPYILTDDVTVSMDWLINPHERYESDSAADVDNIVKPLLDAMCGPEGLLIDDCQVQRLDVLWRDRYIGEEMVEVEIRFDRDAWMLKEGLFFLTLGRGLVFPMSITPGEMVLLQAEHLVARFEMRNQMNAELGNRDGDMLQPIQRAFHISRVQQFKQLTVEEIRQRFQPLEECRSPLLQPKT